MDDLEQKVIRRGYEVVGKYDHIGPGWDHEALYPAVRAAKEAGAMLVAADVSRFVRPLGYNGSNESAVLQRYDLVELARVTRGVRLYTVMDPDATPGEVRSQQTMRGQRHKGNPGGRPVKGRDAYRARWLPVARALRKQGWSTRRIADHISAQGGRDISHVAIIKWLRRGE
jgi:hypothetical protein